MLNPSARKEKKKIVNFVSAWREIKLTLFISRTQKRSTKNSRLSLMTINSLLVKMVILCKPDVNQSLVWQICRSKISVWAGRCVDFAKCVVRLSLLFFRIGSDRCWKTYFISGNETNKVFLRIQRVLCLIHNKRSSKIYPQTKKLTKNMKFAF